jgi:hypothetical protein
MPRSRPTHKQGRQKEPKKLKITTTTLMQNSYSLDSVKNIKIMKLELVDSNYTLDLGVNRSSQKERYQIVKDILMSVDSVTNKGFLTQYDLSRFPVLSTLLPAFRQDVSMDDYLEYLRGGNTLECYK